MTSISSYNKFCNYASEYYKNIHVHYILISWRIKSYLKNNLSSIKMRVKTSLNNMLSIIYNVSVNTFNTICLNYQMFIQLLRMIADNDYYLFDGLSVPNSDEFSIYSDDSSDSNDFKDNCRICDNYTEIIRDNICEDCFVRGLGNGNLDEDPEKYKACVICEEYTYHDIPENKICNSCLNDIDNIKETETEKSYISPNNNGIGFKFNRVFERSINVRPNNLLSSSIPLSSNLIDIMEGNKYSLKSDLNTDSFDSDMEIDDSNTLYYGENRKLL
jgi:hypothetical protein